MSNYLSSFRRRGKSYKSWHHPRSGGMLLCSRVGHHSTDHNWLNNFIKRIKGRQNAFQVWSRKILV